MEISGEGNSLQLFHWTKGRLIGWGRSYWTTSPSKDHRMAGLGELPPTPASSRPKANIIIL